MPEQIYTAAYVAEKHRTFTMQPCSSSKNDSRWHVDCSGDSNSHGRIYLLLNSNTKSKYYNVQERNNNVLMRHASKFRQI